MSGFFSGFNCGWKKFGEYEIKTNEIIAVIWQAYKQTGSNSYQSESVRVVLGLTYVDLENKAYDEFKKWWEKEKKNEPFGWQLKYEKGLESQGKEEIPKEYRSDRSPSYTPHTPTRETRRKYE